MKVTNTPAFKCWFGDSKVVDAEGKPLVVYHGTKAKFTEFKGDAIFFARDEEYASGMVDGKGEMIKAYVSIENPLRVVLDEMDFGSKYVEEGYLKQAKREGRDGVIFTEESGAFESYVAFRPEQIKSATGNNGTFDPDNPDINK